MDLAELFQRTERLLAANEQLRQKLRHTLSQAQRSLNQRAGQESAARHGSHGSVPHGHVARDTSSLTTENRPNFPPPPT